MTVQRRAVLEAVVGRDDHPTADQVFEEVRGRIPGVSRTTVYRVLDMLVRFGVVTKASHPGAIARFDGNTDPHHHLICMRCDRVIDLEDKQLDSLRLPDTSHFGFEITDFHVQVRGVCVECRKKAATCTPGPVLRGTGFASSAKKRERKARAPRERNKRP